MINKLSRTKHCPDCGSESLTWNATVINKTGVQDGRLKIHDVSGLFYLGCEDCSATVAQIRADEVAEFLTKLQEDIV